MTLENLLYNIGNTAIKNKVINYAAAGSSIFELNAETIVDYPLLFASPTGNHEVRVNTTDYEITLYYIDRLLRDSANDVQIFSTGVEQLKLIMRMIENIDGVVEVADTYSISNFAETEKMNDSVAGAFATVTITVLNTSECDDIQTIASFTKLQEKTVVIDENGEYVITYNSNYEGLKKVEVVVEVPDLNGDYDTGFEDGKAEGITEGYDNGFAIGKTEGYTEGNTAGYQLGYNVGNSEGFIKGKAVGYDLGKFEGYEEGYQVGQAEGVEVYVETLPTLTITENGTYDTVNKGVEVNVVPKIKAADYGLKISHSSFTEIPEWLDLNGCTDWSYMFYFCSNLTSIPLFDTSKVETMESAFAYCTQITELPLFDLSSCKNLSSAFQNLTKCTTLPAFNTSKVKTMNTMLSNCTGLTTLPAYDCSGIGTGYNAAAWVGYGSLPNLVNIGGFIGLKTKSDSSYGLAQLPNLTYESCINVLNGLYDFTSNNEVPDSNQGKLKVHPNFLTTVGDEISIGLNKGWTITS